MELINREDSAWPIVQEWIGKASNHVEVLPPIDDASRSHALVQTQVTTRSPMGAVVYETGGIIVDHGWLRILGSGHPRLFRSLPGWNQPRTYRSSGAPPPFLLVADDVAGGFFALDGGGLQTDPGKVCYFAPDALKWESMGRGYSDFLGFCFSGNLPQFYETFRWANWEVEVAALGGHQALGIYPPLWTKGPPLEQRYRSPVSIAEVYRLLIDQNAPL